MRKFSILDTMQIYLVNILAKKDCLFSSRFVFFPKYKLKTGCIGLD